MVCPVCFNAKQLDKGSLLPPSLPDSRETG
jgi:hypothetical protein